MVVTVYNKFSKLSIVTNRAILRTTRLRQAGSATKPKTSVFYKITYNKID